jgi:hypothetical protein
MPLVQDAPACRRAGMKKEGKHFSLDGQTQQFPGVILKYLLFIFL